MAKKNFTSIRDMFADMYNSSAYTVIGCGGDLAQWTEGYNSLLHQAGLLPDGVDLTDDAWYPEFWGREINEVFRLTGNNAYPDDLVFLALDWNSVPELARNVGGLAMFKMRCEDRWFDDVVDNDVRREHNGKKTAGDFININKK